MSINKEFSKEGRYGLSTKLIRVLDVLPTAAAIINHDVICYVNEEFCRLVQFKKEELVDADISLINLSKADLYEMMALNEAASSEAMTTSTEITVIGGDGIGRRLHISFMPFTEKELKEGTVLTAMDVTDVQDVMDQISRHERRLTSFAKIVEFEASDLKDALDYSLDEAIKLTDSKIGYFYYYSEATKMFKLNTWSKDVMPSCSVENKQTEYELDKTGCWGEAVRQRKPFVLNKYTLDNPYTKGTPEGHIKMDRFMTVPIFDKEEIVAVVGVANKETDYDEDDIRQLSFLMTFAWKVLERLRFEQALVDSEKELQIIFDNSPNIMMVVEDDFSVSKINKKGIEFSDMSQEEVIGGTPGRVFGCKARGECTGECDSFNRDPGCIVKQSIAETFKTKETVIRQEETLTISKENIDRQLNMMVSTAAIEEKDNHHVLLAVDDVTEQKVLQQQLSQSQRLQAIGQLAGGIAHDFNNVLAGIIGYSELMERELLQLADSYKLRKYNKHILDGSNRARELVKQILTFSRRNRDEFKMISISPIIHEVMDLLRVTLPSSINIITEISDEPMVIKGNTTMIHELMINIISNANHSMNGRGRIVIRLNEKTLFEPVSGIVNDLDPGRYVVLEVEDNGEGIDPAIAEHMFEPFFTTKIGEDGTGMGLSVVYGIVQNHEGAIRVENVQPHGALFRFYFALQETSSLVFDRSDERIVPIKGKGRKILLVDDEEIVLGMLAEYLQEQGFEVYSLSNSETAVQMLQEGNVPFDLIITDQTMPVISGIEVASYAQRNYRNVPVVLCTGDDSMTREGGRPLWNVAKCLPKPIRLTELSSVIDQLLSDND